MVLPIESKEGIRVNVYDVLIREGKTYTLDFRENLIRGLDSLSMVEMTINLEDRFNISFNNKALDEIFGEGDVKFRDILNRRPKIRDVDIGKIVDYIAGKYDIKG